MLVTHSEIFPGTFASTTETADYMLRALGLRRAPVLKWGPRGMQQLGEAEDRLQHGPEDRVAAVVVATVAVAAVVTVLVAAAEALAEVETAKSVWIEAARAAGIQDDNIVVDPGLGFSKTADDNWRLLAGVEEFHKLGFPLLVKPVAEGTSKGVTKKSIVRDEAELREVVKEAESVWVALNAHPLPLVACHCDPLCENFLDTGERMWLVDWEYSGMNDPMWDLGDLCVEG